MFFNKIFIFCAYFVSLIPFPWHGGNEQSVQGSVTVISCRIVEIEGVIKHDGTWLINSNHADRLVGDKRLGIKLEMIIFQLGKTNIREFLISLYNRKKTCFPLFIFCLK